MFSKTCEYAFRATVVVATASAKGGRLTLGDIAEQTAAPTAFTAKVLQDLVRAGILTSRRGPNGGFDLPPKVARTVNLRMIMEAIGDVDMDTACVMGLKECRASEPCPLHHEFIQMKNELARVLDNTYVHGLVDALNNGTTHLKR
ncbi:MAG: Rrf2 family transcriptional regulator [Flavobacteriales bacterium]|jgi:Rrf2 family protein|nr:Rrf2 family transcriptional regulator [Flavobacteriales bacterium]MCB0758805.1 Rrf2 family transcriptional regulator [Flavobacteriales bacterium]